ncbi:hypothetical protein Tco_1198521, partial [Tanacetum coccineum]
VNIFKLLSGHGRWAIPLDKLVRPVALVSTVPPVVSEALDQALVNHTSNDLPFVV